MSDSAIKIEGFENFNKALDKAPVELAKELEDAMAKSIAEIHREVIPRTPLDTGKLRQAYREKVTRLKGVLSNNIIYAWRQHEGFYNHPRGGERKYLDNAVKAKTKNTRKNFEQAIANTWKYVIRKTK